MMWRRHCRPFTAGVRSRKKKLPVTRAAHWMPSPARGYVALVTQCVASFSRPSVVSCSSSASLSLSSGSQTLMPLRSKGIVSTKTIPVLTYCSKNYTMNRLTKLREVQTKIVFKRYRFWLSMSPGPADHSRHDASFDISTDPVQPSRKASSGNFRKVPRATIFQLAYENSIPDKI
mmetsp:Transcript_23815/g.70358  ORF Transcript_23815/g.70358 Transcript_23815/m.70358 type:complete len:175 (+) Transcript_23815:367-891(+)